VASTAKIVAGLATFPPSPGKAGRNGGENPHRHSAVFRKAFRKFCKHCKVVYFVDEEADTLVIADVWDTRREPKNLMQNL
jgi:hypothetical protein